MLILQATVMLGGPVGSILDLMFYGLYVTAVNFDLHLLLCIDVLRHVTIVHVLIDVCDWFPWIGGCHVIKLICIERQLMP